MHRKLCQKYHLLDKLFTFVEKKLKENDIANIEPEIDRPQQPENPTDIKNPTKRETQAAKTIQRAWRSMPTKKQLMKKGHKGHTEWLERQNVNEEMLMLSELMFGRTIADIRNYHEFRNPNVNKDKLYHRSDIYNTMDMKFINLLREIIKDPDIEINNKNVIPINKQKSFNFKKFAETSFLPVDLINIKDSNIALIHFPNKYQPEQFNHITKFGLIASPWEMKKLYAEAKSKPGINEQKEDMSKYIQHQQFLTSNEMISLSKLALSKKAPTKELAANLFRLLRKLNIDDHDPEERKLLQRIHMMLATTQFYKNDYRRFALVTSAIIHEISLLAYHRIKKGDQLVKFSEFKKATEKNILSHFGIKLPKKDLNTAAIPANSGANAFAIAMQCMKKIHGNNKIDIKFIEPIYYEFTRGQRPTKAKYADAYFISAGPIVDAYSGLNPGTDINKFIRQTILPALKKGKKEHITLAIDTTTALYKNLALDEEFKKLVTSGKLTLINFESYQKFGLVHSDQAQCGAVTMLSSDLRLTDELAKTFNHNAKEDLNSHIDMQVGAYINTSAGKYLEHIKERHFKSGALLKKAVKQMYGTESIRTEKKDSIKNEDEHLFLTLPRTHRFAKHSGVVVPGRDSFGHFHPSIAGICDYLRISPGASDTIDDLIMISGISMVAAFEMQETDAILKDFMTTTIQNNVEKLTTTDQIILTGLLVADYSNTLDKRTSITAELIFLRALAIQICLKHSPKALQNRPTNSILNLYLKNLEKFAEKSCKYILRFVKRPLNPENNLRFLLEMEKQNNNKLPRIERQRASAKLMLLSFNRLGNNRNQISVSQLNNDDALVKMIFKNRKKIGTQAEFDQLVSQQQQQYKK